MTYSMTRPRDWRERAVSPQEVVRYIESKNRVFVHGAAATPTPLLDALTEHRELDEVRLYHLHTAGRCAFTDPEHQGRFISNSLFTGEPCRAAVAEGRADYIPVFLSDIPGLFLDRLIPLDAALVQLSPPDQHGNCTLGPSIDTALAATRSAKFVLAEINEQMPRTHGHTVVPFERIHAFTITNRPLVEHHPAPLGPVETRIGELIADLVEDGATLQMGIGAIPDAVLANLGNKLELGVHTEMFSDGLIDLVRAGVITNSQKEVHRGRTSTSFVAGTKKLFDFVDENLNVEFHPCDRTNNTSLIARNPKVVAINSALSIDLTGQVVADSIGHRIYSGIGGQMDFIRGAAQSEGGKPIIAMPSTAAKGQVSRITHELLPGSGIVTTRGHVHWVITEYGAVNLHGKTLRERGEALIGIAHPDFRGELRRQLAEIRHFMF